MMQHTHTVFVTCVFETKQKVADIWGKSLEIDHTLKKKLCGTNMLQNLHLH
jgi:hypothetical protein